jgi:ATP-binding cassette subfamily B protein
MRGDTPYILSIGGLMLLITAGSLVCAVAATWLSSLASTGMAKDIRARLFRQVEGFTLHEFDKYGTATLITRSTNDITQVQHVTIMMLRMLVMAPLMASGGIIMAASKDGPLTLTLAVAVPVIAVVILFIMKFAMPLYKSIQGKVDRLNLVLREGLTGIRVIRAFNRSAREEERFEEANADITRTNITVNRIMAFAMPAMMLIMNLTSVSILWFGVGRIDSGGMQMGNLIAFTQYAMQIMFSFLMMSMMFIMVPRAQAAAERIAEVLAERPGITDPAKPVTPAAHRGDVEFRDVCFAYHGAEEKAVQNISFHARGGETTAIIGSTGSGKSTLVKLIPRFYDVDCGQVLVDGVDVRAMAQAELRSRIGYVPQQAMLFTGTIDSNLRFGAPMASEAELAAAARVAQAAEFIAGMDGGFAHDIAQGGANVSGGQKQRLAIARALVRKPDIYIFDDSFSALDFKTDARLRAALKDQVKGATVIIVAQRVGTVMDADRIIVLDDGKIVGMGKHALLLESCPVYREIAVSQLSEEVSA